MWTENYILRALKVFEKLVLSSKKFLVKYPHCASDGYGRRVSEAEKAAKAVWVAIGVNTHGTVQSRSCRGAVTSAPADGNQEPFAFAIFFQSLLIYRVWTFPVSRSYWAGPSLQWFWQFWICHKIGSECAARQDMDNGHGLFVVLVKVHSTSLKTWEFLFIFRLVAIINCLR